MTTPALSIGRVLPDERLPRMPAAGGGARLRRGAGAAASGGWVGAGMIHINRAVSCGVEARPPRLPAERGWART